MGLSIVDVRKATLAAIDRTVDMLPKKQRATEKEDPEIAEIQRLTRKYMKQAKGDVFVAIELGCRGDPAVRGRSGQFDPSGDNGYYPRPRPSK